jgi:amino acid adenylation domain-containing protein/non-ribosomal peptide synthase protein (TIGR01720 family)
MKLKNVEDIYPLSPMQQGLLFHSLYSDERRAYVEQICWTVVDDINEAAFEKSWREVIARHPALRTCFFATGLKQPVQVVRQSVEIPWQRLDWRDLSAEALQHTLQTFLESDRRRGFDLTKAPLLRLTHARVSAEAHQFICTYHHLILDGWSIALVLKEVFECYQSLLAGRQPQLARARPYRDYIHWLQQQDTKQSEAYWHDRLEGITGANSLSIEKIAGEGQTYLTQQSQLSAFNTEQLRLLARKHQLTLSNLVEGAWTLLLSRYSDSAEVVFGLVVMGRPPTLPGVESMIGLFINTLPMHVTVRPDADCVSWLKELQRQQLEMRQYEYTSLSQILGWSSVPRGQQLFQSILAFDNAAEDQGRNAQITNVFRANSHTTYPLTLGVLDGTRLTFNLTYDTARFDAPAIARLLAHLETLITHWEDCEQKRLSDLSLLTNSERHQLLIEWNDTAVQYDENSCIPKLFEAQVQRSPDAIAVVFEGSRLTYAELNRLADRLAGHLQTLDIGPETVVGIYAERSLEMVWALLGVLKTGAAYLPLDPAYPRELLSFMLKDSGVTVLLTQSELAHELPPHIAQVVILNDDHIGSGVSRIKVDPLNVAYAIYTSGSTGTPKAALNTHRGIVNRLRWMQDRYQLTANDRVLQKTPFTFDVSVWEFLWPLITGARLVLARPGGHQDAAYLIDLIVKEDITTLHFVPSMLRVWLETPGVESCSQLQRVICSGEALSADLEQLFFSRLKAELHNLYGPTEAAVDVTSWQCQPDNTNGSVPIGRPISNIRIYLLDRELEPVPVGLTGELYIGGVGVARSYLRRPDLTAERFVPDPFGGEPGARLYRTGDLAKYRYDGNIEFLNRLDHQIKLHGFRIELGEIEAKLGSHPAVREAVVIAVSTAPDDQRLIAYITPVAGQKPTIKELRQFLKECVPHYMVPAAFVSLERLPLTATGKIDRRALPLPGAGRPDLEETFVAPRNEVETALVAIWKEVLAVNEVGINDNFFELGGDSILSMQIVFKAKQAGLDLVPKDLFKHQTIAELAAAATPAIATDAEQGIVSGPVPLTPIQSWFFEDAGPDPNHFNQAVLLTAPRGLNRLLFQRAVEKLLVHHDALRLRFNRDGTHWQQTNAAAEEATIFRCIDLSESSPPEREKTFRELSAQLQSSLSLSSGPIVSVTLFDFGDTEPARILMIVHHLAVDGVSWRILLEDLESAYEQLLRGDSVTLPPKTTSFRTWAEGLRTCMQSEEVKNEADYWLRQSSKPVKPLPVDFNRGENTVASADQLKVSLSVADTRALLRDVPAVSRLQSNDLLLTALALALTQLTRQERLRIDIESHGRQPVLKDVDVTRTVGWFTSLFPVTFELESNAHGPALIAMKEALRSVPRDGVGYGLLYYGESTVRTALREAPRAEICFNYLGQFDQSLTRAGLFQDGGEPPGPTCSLLSKRKYLLEVDGRISNGELSLVWTYSRNFHLASTIEKLAHSFIAELRALLRYCHSLNHPVLTPSDFPLASLNQPQIELLLAERGNIEDVYALSPMQEGMLFYSVRAPESETYCEQMSFRLDGPLDIPSFKRAWQQAVARNSILRTAFVWKSLSEPVQVVCRDASVQIEEHDWRDLPSQQRTTRLAELRKADLSRGFDFSKAPLMRLTLLQLEEQSFELVWTYHHIVLDGWSVPLLFKDVLDGYESLSLNGESQIGARGQYRQYISWLKDHDLKLAEEFWRGRLRGFREPTSIAGDVSVVSTPPDKDHHEQEELAISSALVHSLRALTREHRLTLNTVAQGCWALFLSKYSGQSDVVFGATVSGRPTELAGSENMIGLFINTLPVRVHVTDESVLTWLKRLQEEQAEASQYVYSSLAQVQGWCELPRGTALFENLMVFENYPFDASLEQQSGSLDITSARNAGSTDYPLTLVVVPGDEVVIRLLFDSHRFSRTMITRMLVHLENLMRGVAGDVQQSLSQLSLLTEAEEHTALIEWNDTRAEYPADKCFHHLFEQQVSQSPNALAVSYEQERLTYEDLNTRANQLAHHLIGLKVGPEVRVGICLSRSPALVIARLAVLKAGGAYVSLDPEHPPARLAFVLEDARVPVLLTAERFLDRFVQVNATIVCVDRDSAKVSEARDDNPSVSMSTQNLAYVYYTSGSTGRPKGVEIDHTGLVNLVTWHNRAYGVTPDDRKSQIAGLAFDASVWELWPYLVAGASVHIPTEETRASWPKLLQWMVTEGITICFLPTPLAEAVIEGEWPAECSLRAVLTGGDKLHRWPQQPLPFAFVNKYGPTEVSAVTTWAPMSPATLEYSSPPIGRPIANTETFVLDDRLQPVPVGVTGELYIGGIGLARGYLSQPELTAEKFIPHPFSNQPGARLYRSGDLALYRPDGNIEFVGRCDSQVKIRGYRIELGEIERVLLEHSKLREAVVLASGDQSDVKQLTAYLVPDEGQMPTREDLREFLSERLPVYMVPSVFVILESLPVTANGKVDRRALSVLQRTESGPAHAYVEPQDPVQETLAEIWSAVLGVALVGIDDNFFELGGDSILSIRIIARASQKGIEISADELFLHPTIREIAAKATQKSLAVSDPTPTQSPTNFPNADLSQRELNALLAHLAKRD